ncbi:MAG: hypothetical protein HFE28_07445 [Clostridia bacterium]|nr:hypothetical protein [Clostridia bacterium]
MKSPFYDAYRILSKIYSEGAHLKIALAETKCEEISRAGTVKTVYGVLEHDAYLQYCMKTFAPKNPKQSVRIILKIALYHIVFLQKPVYLVTDSAVQLAKAAGKGGAAGFVNAFLRAFDHDRVTLPAGDEGLAIASNYPLFVVERLRKAYGARAEAIVKAKSQGVSVRFVRGTEGYLARPHLDTPFENVKIFERFVRDEGFFAGDYTFQSVGSVAICSIVEPCRDFLDACAAPGGKSVLLSERCGAITANEYHAHRVRLIEQYCARMGVKNVRAVQGDAAVFRSDWEHAFDGVLCDVPCSGLGTLCENPDIALHKSEEGVTQLTAVQRAILDNCARYVKAEGFLYYATCSLLEEENDAVVLAFLHEHADFTFERAACALAHENTRCGMQFLPDQAFGAGFYVSKLRRKA